MNLKHKSDQSVVLMKAFNNACQDLNVGSNEKSALLGVNRSTLARNNESGFLPESKTGEIQLNFIRIYRSLYAIAGGNVGFMQHWFSTDNKALNGKPAVLCQKLEGMFRVNMYLDAMRGKI